MTTINLYQPKKFDFTIEFPTGWNDLQYKELMFVARSLLTETDPAAARALILKFIMENRVGNTKKVLPADWFLQIDPEQVVIDCFPLLDFIFQQNNLTNDLEPVALGKIVYHPQSFKYITCGEYEDAEVAANQFAEDPSAEALAKLAAILFRPLAPVPDPEDDYADESPIVPYMQLNERTKTYYTYRADQKIKIFKKLPSEQLYAIFIWYAGNRAELPSMFPEVFATGTNEEEKDLMAFTKCIHSGAGPKNGTRQEIRITKLFEFMLDMNEEARKARELEEEYERMKNQH